MKVLTVSTLYPNAAAPAHGVFVENRLDAFRRHSGDDVRVIAPVPWFAFSSPMFGRYARFARAPRHESRRDIDIRHPRYLVLPKIGMTLAVSSLSQCILRQARRLIAEGWDFDLIDAHYLYPDGVAALRAAQILGKPVVLTARGSDVTQLTRHPAQRAMILDAVRRADGVVAVAGALKSELEALGAPAEKIVVLRNGVDLDLFKPLDRAAIRERMQLRGPVIASVGHLIERKGHDIAIKALAAIDDATLLIVGEGPEEGRLRQLAKDQKVADRVRFLGALPHHQLADIYNAADALALASTREGWPNVLLEAMACGAPVVASNAGGNAEVVASPDAGIIAGERSPDVFAAALKDILTTADRTRVRRYAQGYSWRDTSQGLAALFGDIVDRSRKSARMRIVPLAPAGRDKPRLLLTVDTEEEFDWRSFDDADHAVSHPDHIDRLQTLCAEFGVRPLYFLTYPMMQDPPTRDYFRTLLARGAADLGLHPHAWNTPPVAGHDGAYYSWQGNLPADIHAAKLATMARAFTDAFGQPALAHRAGRYGMTRAAYHELAAAGVRYDFSPSPGFDFSKDGGPDFSGASNHPFSIESEAGRILVTPVSGARALRGGRLFFSQPRQPGQWSARRRPPGFLSAPLRLTCEQARLEDLISLTRRLGADRVPVATFSLHSTSLTPGANPYAPDAAAVDASLALIRRYLEFFTGPFGGEIIGFSGLEKIYSAKG